MRSLKPKFKEAHLSILSQRLLTNQGYELVALDMADT